MKDRVVLAALMFGITFIVQFVWIQRYQPVLGNDAVTYHFPVAARWLAEHRLSLFPTWFFNPANTYSPLAGSAFIAWWMGLTGDDLLARYVQVPPLILIGTAGFNVLRQLRCPAIPASLLATGLLVCRPLFCQAVMGKDDLYMTAFFVTAVGSLSRSRDAWKLGASIGLMLACKMTALLTLPVLLLAFGMQMRPRQWCIATIVSLLLAGPWYARNWLMTGNPLFPIDFLWWPGLFSTARAPEIASFVGLGKILFFGSYSLPPLVAGALFAGWVYACVRAGKNITQSGLIRLILIGPWISVALFVWKSPFPEVRFVMPAFVLLFLSVGLGIGRGLRQTQWQIALAGAAAALCVATSLTAILLLSIGLFTAIGLMVAGATIVLAYLPRKSLAGITVIGGLATVACVYVYWNVYAKEVKTTAPDVWSLAYGPESVEAWIFIQTQLPDKQPLAHTGTHFVYPLMGSDGCRPVFYVPTRKNIQAIHDLPRLGDHLTGDQLVTAMRAAMANDPDEGHWLAKLRASNASHLVVFKSDNVPLPETAMTGNNPSIFKLRFSNAAATIYQIQW